MHCSVLFVFTSHVSCSYSNLIELAFLNFGLIQMFKLFLAYFSKCIHKYDKVWFTILWDLLDAGGLQYRTIYTTQQYWLSLWCLWSHWWLCHCDGFIFVMALSLFRLLHQTMWHNRVGLSLVYSLFVWLTLWIWWHYCYRFVMVHIVKLLLHWCFICLENSITQYTSVVVYSMLLWW